MRNEGATWEQIVGLAKSLDFQNRADAGGAEDPVLLARLVLEFHRTVVAQPVKRTTASERAA
jgi:hypothetical protein